MEDINTPNDSKSLEDKNIIERHTRDGKFNLSSALLEQDTKIKALQEAMVFMAKWYDEVNSKPKQDILVPETKIILPNG